MLSIALSLGGCAAAQDTGATPPPTSPDSAQAIDTDASAGHTPKLADIPADTLLASGSFSARGSAAGSVEIRSAGDGGLTVNYVDLAFTAAPGATIQLSSLPADASLTQLRDSFSFYRYDEVQQGSSSFVSPPSDDFFTSDPSWMRSAILWEPVEGVEKFGRVVGVAPLRWSLPDMRPGLTVRDTGSMKEARGKAAVSGGIPTAYVVAIDDTLSAIGERFGVTVDDLTWLNPGRGGGDARDGETLNLSRDERGIR